MGISAAKQLSGIFRHWGLSGTPRLLPWELHITVIDQKGGRSPAVKIGAGVPRWIFHDLPKYRVDYHDDFVPSIEVTACQGCAASQAFARRGAVCFCCGQVLLMIEAGLHVDMESWLNRAFLFFAANTDSVLQKMVENAWLR